jgi:hypothetical protein
MYHAYSGKTNVYTGREGLIMEFRFTEDGWIEFVKDKEADVAVRNVDYNFRGKKLKGQWQWSVFHQPGYHLKGGRLFLETSDGDVLNYLGHKILTGDFVATTKINTRKSGANAALAVIGDEKNMVMASYEKGWVKLVRITDGRLTEIASQEVPGKKIILQVDVTNGNQLRFYIKSKTGGFKMLGKSIDGSNLPPWDRALRVGLLASGENGSAAFDSFNIINKTDRNQLTD